MTGRHLKALEQSSIQGLTTGRCWNRAFRGSVTHCWWCLLPRGLRWRRAHLCSKQLTIFFGQLGWIWPSLTNHLFLCFRLTFFFNQTVLNKDIQSSQWHSYILKIQLPDDSVPLTVCNVGVVCEQNGVVGHHWLTGGQNASCHIAYTVQNAVIHQEVVHQQLYTHRQTDIQIATGGPNVAQQWLHSSQETDTLTPNSFTPLCGVFE